jgi:predicted ATP-binding protein involved in virulence
MRIRKLHIEKLYGKYNFEWIFDEKVNILAGINGSFKSTLLNVISQMCQAIHTNYDLSHIYMSFSEGYDLNYLRMSLNSQLNTPEKKREFFAKVKEAQPDFELPMPDGDYDNLNISINHFSPMKNGERISEDDFKKAVRFDFISTFDIKHETKQDESQLDAILKDLQSEYGYYLSDLAKEVNDFVASHDTLTKGDLDRINHNKDVFISIVNDEFKETNKVIDPNESKIVFIHQNDKTRIPAAKLSAGEKQLLIILLTVLLQKQAECIVVMDEPEISLHVRWQYSLIDNLLKLNPNAQFILSTHSPSIFGKGWGGKVVYAHKLISTEDGRS